MPRILIVVYILFFFTVNLFGQLYHYKTGKVLAVNEPNQIIWKKGTYNNYPADYGTLIVKENRNSRNSKLINIPIIRIKAINTDTVSNTVFLLNGGPGESNFQPQLFFEELIQNHDIVMVGYRGVDGSVKLNCNCMQNAFMSDTISLKNSEQLFQKAIDSCLNQWKNNQIDILGYSMDEVVDDIEITRQILNYNKINILAFSYGTMLSQLYNQKYTDKVDKMALIGARPLNDFLFDEELYNRFIFRLYNKFSKVNDTLLNSDSLEVVLAKVEKLLFSIIDNNKELNPYRFLFFGFSKLYYFEDIEKVFDAYACALKGNSGKLIKLYNEFYNNFPGDIMTGDIILKKQGRVVFNGNSGKYSIGSIITKSINLWYTPNLKLLNATNSISNTSIKNDSVNVLFISGEFDVASPAYSILQNDYLGYINCKFINVPDAGHLDLFYSKKESVKKELVSFFCN